MDKEQWIKGRFGELLIGAILLFMVVFVGFCLYQFVSFFYNSERSAVFISVIFIVWALGRLTYIYPPLKQWVWD